MKETYFKLQDVLKAIERYGNSALLSDVLNLNPADVASIRRGVWTFVDDDLDRCCVKCSVCGEEWVLEEDATLNDMNLHFCPNCGAHMR